MIKTLLLSVVIAWTVALVLPVILKAVRNKKGDNSEDK